MRQLIDRRLLCATVLIWGLVCFGWSGCKYVRTAGSPMPEVAEETPEEEEDFAPLEPPAGAETTLPPETAAPEETEPTPEPESAAPAITETELIPPPPVEKPATVAPAQPKKAGPDDAVRAFYRALAEKDCAAAMRLRPGYAEERCRKITQTEILKLKIDFETPCEAVIFLKVHYAMGTAKQTWSGFLYCYRADGAWVIDDKSFDSKTARAEYQKKFVQYKACEEAQPEPVPAPAKPDEPKKTIEDPAAAREEKTTSPATAAKELPLPTREELSFGSQAVLDACWTMSQLNGMPGDERTSTVAESDAPPPAKPAPTHKPAPVPARWRDNIRRMLTPGGRKVVALTFNAGERRRETKGYDREVVNYLRANGVKATFFLGGKWMSTHPDKAKQLMADPLFEVGNLAWSGGNFRMLNERERREQVDWTQAQYELLREELVGAECAAALDAGESRSIPPIPYVFRFPYGTCNEQALAGLAEAGLPTIQWDVVTADSWSKQTAEGIEAIVMNKTKSGSIIICQADGAGHGTAAALSVFVPKLRAQGYQFVTVSELLRMGVADRHAECFEETPGDNAKYDEAFGKGLD